MTDPEIQHFSRGLRQAFPTWYETQRKRRSETISQVVIIICIAILCVTAVLRSARVL